MAKHAKQSNGSESGLTYVPFGLLAPNHDLINAYTRKHRRDAEESKTLRFSLARNGWDVDLGGICAVFGEDSPIWSNYQDWIDACVRIREAQLQELSEGKFPESLARLVNGKREFWVGNWAAPSFVLEQFKVAYCDSKGKILRPRYIPNTGNGRMEEYFQSQCMRACGWQEANDNKHEPQDPVWVIPCHMSRYFKEYERVDAQVKENNKEIGQVKMSATDNLRSSYFMLSQGMPAQAVRNRYPGTSGQRNVNLWEIDSHWAGKETNPAFLFPNEDERPNLHIIERMLLDPPGENEAVDSETGWIDLKAGNLTTELTKIRDRSDPELLAKRNAKNKKESLDPITAEEVNDFFTDQKEPAPKPLGKTEWTSIRNIKCRPLQEMANAHLKGTTETPGLEIMKDANNAKVFNEVYTLLEGKVPAALILSALQCIKDPSFDAYRSAVLSGKTVRIVVETPETTEVSDLVNPEEEPSEVNA